VTRDEHNPMMGSHGHFFTQAELDELEDEGFYPDVPDPDERVVILPWSRP
jgi:hypothetical protein